MAGMVEASQYEGLALTETSVSLPLPQSGGRQITVKLVHIQDPKSSNFSTKKKQCDLWEYVWGSSILLSGLLAQIDMTGLNVLEIGCGHGLCSLTAALSGATVLATDLVQDAVNLVRRSADRNGILSKMDFRAFSWNKRESIGESEFDVILGSDVLFYNGTVSPVAHTIDRALKPGGVAIVVDPFRLGVDDFVDKIMSLGLQAEVLLFSDKSILDAKTSQEAEAVVKAKKAKLVLIKKALAPGDAALPALESFTAKLKGIVPEFTAE